MRDVSTIKPMPGWAVCRSLKPITTRASGIIMPTSLETGKLGECVAEVLSVTWARSTDGSYHHPGFDVGDKVLIRDFLKFANAVGDMVGADRDDRVFILNSKDVLAVVSGAGKLGFYDEYELTE